jgi:hypothetical protein
MHKRPGKDTKHAGLDDSGISSPESSGLDVSHLTRTGTRKVSQCYKILDFDFCFFRRECFRILPRDRLSVNCVDGTRIAEVRAHPKGC